MDDQKAENLLNLALNTPEEERARTEELDVGYDTAQKTWEVIVKYNGNLRSALEASYPEVRMRELLGGFAVLTVPEALVDEVIGLWEIEYAEKPKRLFFAVNQARAASCLAPVQSGPEALSGTGVLVAVIDSGIDYFHGDFRHEDGSTRILYLADQTTGKVYGQEEINEALRTGDRTAAGAIVPSFDTSGHGTAVAGIAAGNGRESAGRYRGVAWESDLVVVRLGSPDPEGFPRTTQVMEGIDFAVRAAMALKRPVAVNLSFGNTYGSHDGGGLFERYLDSMAQMGQSVFVIGTGNEGDTGGHTAVQVLERQESVVEFAVAPYETGLNIQIWKEYEDDLLVSLRNPGRTATEQLSRRRGNSAIDMGNTKVLVYYGEPGPFNQAQEIYLDFIPKGDYLESGVWQLLLYGQEIRDGMVHFWLPSAAARNQATRFLNPAPDTTLTIPSTALRPISVGAYDDSTLAYAAFSGRGDTRVYQIQKPDLAAPGVGIITAKSGGGYAPVTGTSFAAPFVTGAAALLMEWGIVRGNDPYLYGDKVKAYLRKGARKLPGELMYPNPRVGYGALCVADSLPK